MVNHIKVMTLHSINHLPATFTGMVFPEELKQ